jgi:AraC-like DNA-binding protein
VRGGEAVVLAGGQTFDVTNRMSERGSYGARWLVWDPAVLEAFERTAPEGPVAQGVTLLGKADAAFADAFDRAIEAVGDAVHIPEAVARHRVTELLVWLSLKGVRVSAAENLSLATRVRRLFEASIADPWTIAAVADRFALSEATLRRRLALEGTTVGDLLIDVRMSQAMLLLQSTDQAVNRIALDVGYESPSRFANRFRERFGFAPTAIRGHARGVERGMRRRGEMAQVATTAG